MAKQNPNERYSVENQLLTHFRDLKSAEREHQRACLELRNQDTPERQREVTELEAEIRHHELAIERLNASTKAEDEQTVVINTAAKDARLAALTIQRDAEAAKAKQAAIALVDYLAPVGAMWTEGLNGLSKCSAITREILRLSGTKDALKRFDNRVDTNGHSVLGVAVGSALAATGLGSHGPNLLPYAAITPTTTPFTASDLERQLGNMFDRQAEAIDKARNPQPATTTEE